MSPWGWSRGVGAASGEAEALDRYRRTTPSGFNEFSDVRYTARPIARQNYAPPLQGWGLTRSPFSRTANRLRASRPCESGSNFPRGRLKGFARLGTFTSLGLAKGLTPRRLSHSGRERLRGFSFYNLASQGRPSRPLRAEPKPHGEARALAAPLSHGLTRKDFGFAIFDFGLTACAAAVPGPKVCSGPDLQSRIQNRRSKVTAHG